MQNRSVSRGIATLRNDASLLLLAVPIEEVPAILNHLMLNMDLEKKINKKACNVLSINTSIMQLSIYL
jgi:hypothetical protein